MILEGKYMANNNLVGVNLMALHNENSNLWRITRLTTVGQTVTLHPIRSLPDQTLDATLELLQHPETVPTF